MMKRLLMLMICGVCLSCGPNYDRLIDQYEDAMNAENYGEARQILAKIDEEKLTPEQQHRLLDISTGGAFGAYEEFLMKATRHFGEALNKELSSADDVDED